MRSVVIVMIMTFTTLFLYIGKQETEMSVVIALIMLCPAALSEAPNGLNRIQTIGLALHKLADPYGL